MNYSLLNSAVKTLLSLNHFIPLLVYSNDKKPAFVTAYCNLTRYPEIINMFLLVFSSSFLFNQLLFGE